MGNAKFTWTHGRGRRFSDPINVEFDADLNDVEKAFSAIPWHVIRVPIIHDQRLIDGRVQKLHMASEPDWRFWRTRYHIRLWENKGGPITGSVHLERFTFPNHEVLSFDAAEQEVVDEFRKLGNWQKNRNSPDLRNRTDRPANDGSLTIISKV